MKSYSFRLAGYGALFALLITACSSQSAKPQPTVTPTALPSTQTDTKTHAPVILKVAERTEIKNGQAFMHEDITFTDMDGDVTLIVDKLVLSTQDSSASNVEISVSPDEQKNGATVTDTWKCGSNPMITVETRIQDKAGHLSDPVTINIACPTPQPDILPFLIAAVVIGVGLLLGTWLMLRNRPSERSSIFQSLLLLFCLLFPLYFAYLTLHEGGHALTTLMHGKALALFFVHPFSFAGYNLPPFDWNSALFHAGGVLVALPVSLILSIPFWKRRSISNLPLVMLFPWVAILQGMRIMTVGGDFSNIVHLTGLPILLFIVTGLLIVGIGILFLVSILPLFGLAPGDRKSVFVLPTALFLWSVLGMIVAYVFVPGSPIDVQFHMTGTIFSETIYFLISGPIIGALLALLYLKLYPKLPVGLCTETVTLTWKDLRIPALLAVISVILGLVIIT
jgi:hypothetical protein